MSRLITAVTHPASDPRGSLRLLLGIDALTCAAFAVLVLAATAPLADLTGLGRSVLTWAGTILVVAAAVLTAATLRRDPPPVLVWLVTAINVSWIAASLALLALSPGLTTAGALVVIAQALVVAAAVVVELRALAVQRPAAAQPAAA